MDKYTYVCDESIYIILKCFIENTYVSIKDLHPCLTKKSDCETRKRVVELRYIEVTNMHETLSNNVFWINPRITEKGLNFIEEHNQFAHIYESGNNIKSEL